MSQEHDHSGSDAEADCQDAVARLYEYLDSELDPGTMALVSEHLHKCSPCLEAFDFHAELRRVVATKCSETMPAELRARLLDLGGGAGAGAGSG